MLNLTQNYTPRGIPIDQLCKHLFICGVPGSGKTTGTYGLLLQLFEHQIPFLVIETAKHEYRSLKMLGNHDDSSVRGLAETLEVYTPDNAYLSPMRFNPLWRPSHVHLDLHLDALLRCFKASIPMFEPLPAVLGEALEAVFSDQSEDHPAPILDDLYLAGQRVMRTKKYSTDTGSDVSAALEVRLGTLLRRTLGSLFRSTICIPDIAHLTTSYSLIEMDGLEGEIKCLLTLFLLTAIHQHVRRQSPPQSERHGSPRLIIVIEEAHNVVGRSADGRSAENQTDVKAAATELICRMLAEFRALGVGLILIDQLPSQVAPQVVKTTGAKLAFRQVDCEDRETLADTMLFGGFEYEEVARLLPGEAYLYAEGYHRAHRLRTADLATLLGVSVPPSDEALAALVRHQAWYQDAQVRRAEEVLGRFRAAMDRYDRQMAIAHHALKKLLQKRTELVRKHGGPGPQDVRSCLAAAIENVGQLVDSECHHLERGIFAEVSKLELPNGPRGPQIEAMRQSHMRRFEDGILDRAENLRGFISQRVAQLRNDVCPDNA
jgi:hypothetical protein